jgi:hypothetical protein
MKTIVTHYDSAKKKQKKQKKNKTENKYEDGFTQIRSRPTPA